MISYQQNGIHYEPDPRHVEAVIRDLGLQEAKAVVTPCAKEAERLGARPPQTETTRAPVGAEARPQGRGSCPGERSLESVAGVSPAQVEENSLTNEENSWSGAPRGGAAVSACAMLAIADARVALS